MSYLFLSSSAVTVHLGATQLPEYVVWHEVRHHITHIAKQWRIDDAWWKKRIFRDYYKVTTDTGFLMLLYRNVETGDWYIQRAYD